MLPSVVSAVAATDGRLGVGLQVIPGFVDRHFGVVPCAMSMTWECLVFLIRGSPDEITSVRRLCSARHRE